MQRLIATLMLLVWSLAAIGCQPQACKDMQACCDEIKGQEIVGTACSDEATQVSDGEKCEMIIETIRTMYEENDREMPQACLSDAAEAQP